MLYDLIKKDAEIDFVEAEDILIKLICTYTSTMCSDNITKTSIISSSKKRKHSAMSITGIM